MSSISIIIPVLNEAASIKKLLQHVLDNSSNNIIQELIIVDGGSTDLSRDIVTTFFQQKSIKTRGLRCHLICSSKGRSKQMNAGANAAKGDVLYFLHADSFPPSNFDKHIVEEIKKGNVAGCFRLQFKHSHWWLKLASWFTQFNFSVCRGGDQSQFIAKHLFKDIGGFDENYIIYEDNILISELYKRKQFKVINKKLITSARRYESKGIWKLQYHFWMIYFKKWRGASAVELHEYYKKYIH